jgi:Acetyltransferases
MPQNIIITPAARNDLPAIATLVATSLSTNPVNMAVFKGATHRAVQQQQKMFSMILPMPQNNLYTARINGELVGVLNFAHSPACQLRIMQKISVLPGLFFNLGTILPRLLHWTGNWGKHDPSTPHCHLGPLTVAVNRQGQGIGSALLTWFCQYVDERKEAAYLETDKPENVRLYEKFGFEVKEEDDVYGVKNWYMFRHPRP